MTMPEPSTEPLPTRCVKAWQKIDALMRHSTDDAVCVIEDIANICDETLATRPTLDLGEDEMVEALKARGGMMVGGGGGKGYEVTILFANLDDAWRCNNALAALSRK